MLLRRYVSENEAKQHHLIPGTSHPSPNTVSWGVEAQPSPRGAKLRRSIKLKSKTSFSVGEDKWLRSMLAVIDVAHVPTGCGTWPAFWMANENSWPRYGEVDIIESTNQDTEVSTTLHTCGDASAHSTQNPNHCSGATKCTMESVSTDLFTGTWAAGNGAPAAFNCDINAPGQYQNQGCSIHGGPGTVGSALNDGGGGIFATEWSMKDLSDGNASKDGGDDLDPLDVPHIAMWFFPRKDLPLGDEMWGAQPDTKAWVAAGHKPYAYFRLGKENCDPKHFSEQQLIFDTTLCGDNAGAKWGSSGCATTSCDPGKTCKPQCEAFVRNSSSTFAEAYWEVYNVSVWGVKTGIPRPHPPGTPTEEMSSYVIVVGVVLGMCIVGCCGYKCWVESRDAEFNRVGRRAEINARLADDSGWEYAHEKQSSGRYGKPHVAAPDVNGARAALIRVLVLLLSLSEQAEAMLVAGRRVEMVVQLRRLGDW